MFRFLKNYKLTRAPGSQYETSNLGYALLSNLLIRISKRPFPDLIQQMILEPLFMKETLFSLAGEQKKRAVMGYEKNRAISPVESEKIYSVLIGAGGLYSTPHDLLTFLSFHLGKETSSLNQVLPIMQTPYHTFTSFRVGLGWVIKLFESHYNLFSLSGQLFGFKTYMGIVPELDTGIIVICNQENVPLEAFAEEILNLHNRKSVP